MEKRDQWYVNILLSFYCMLLNMCILLTNTVNTVCMYRFKCIINQQSYQNVTSKLNFLLNLKMHQYTSTVNQTHTVFSGGNPCTHFTYMKM